MTKSPRESRTRVAGRTHPDGNEPNSTLGQVMTDSVGSPAGDLVLRAEISALAERLANKAQEVRALKADIAARDIMIARLRAGEDPVSVYPTGLGTHEAAAVDRLAPVRRAIEPVLSEFQTHFQSLLASFHALNAARADVLERDQTIASLREQVDAISARLAEVSALYRTALDAVRERGEAQNATIEQYQRTVAELAALRASLDERTQALNEARASNGQLRAEATANAARLTELSTHYATALEAVRERGEAQTVAIAQYQKAAAELAALHASLDERTQALSDAQASNAQLRTEATASAARLTELSTLYAAALEAVRERGEAQTAAIADYQRVVAELAALRASLDERTRALHDAQASNAQLRTEATASAARLTELSTLYAAALEAVRERGEAQTAAIADYQRVAGELAALHASLAERTQALGETQAARAQLQVQLEQVTTRLAEVNQLYLNALEAVRERGEAQTAAITEAQKATAEVASLRGALAEAKEALVRSNAEAERLTTLMAGQSAAGFAELANGQGRFDEMAARLETMAQAADARHAALAGALQEVSLARAEVTQRDQTIAELRHLLEQSRVRLAEVNTLYLQALEVVRERGEAQAAALAERQTMAETVRDLEVRLQGQTAELETVHAALDALQASSRSAALDFVKQTERLQLDRDALTETVKSLKRDLATAKRRATTADEVAHDHRVELAAVRATLAALTPKPLPEPSGGGSASVEMALLAAPTPAPTNLIRDT